MAGPPPFLEKTSEGWDRTNGLTLRWLCVRDRRLRWVHQQNGCRSSAQHGSSHTAQYCARKASAAVRRHHDEVCLGVDRGHADPARRVTQPDVDFHRHLQSLFAELANDRGEIVSCLPRARLLLLVEIRQHTPTTFVTLYMVRRLYDSYKNNLTAGSEQVKCRL